MSDEFDDMFSNGASGSGLDDYEGHPLLFVPTEYQKGGYVDRTGKKIDVVDSTVVSFENPDAPETDDGVRIFAGRLVGGLKKGAVFNMANPSGDPNTGLPRMTIGVLVKGQKSGGQSAPWLLEPIEDKALVAKMAAYARKHFAAQNPFGDPE